MQFSGTDFYRAYRPSACDLRLYLHRSGAKAADPGPYEEVIRRLGERHERNHLATLANVTHVGHGTRDERQARTLQAMAVGADIVGQPFFTAKVELAGLACELIGIPDLLIREGEGYVIRDIKMTRRVNEDDHPEIFWQLRLYAWLFELVVGVPPVRLEVLSGKDEIVPIGNASAGEVVSRLVQVIRSQEAPFEPVGWSRCNGCGYSDHCWSQAESRRDVALVMRVDQSLARALREANVVSYDDLLARFDETQLSAFRRPWGAKTQKVGKAAGTILLSARALQTKQPIRLALPDIPDVPNFVMFDLEGLPPHLDELDKIYLWGLQVFGENPSPFAPAVAGFGPNGDREGWEAFLAAARVILDTYGDIPFVHWSHYEGTKLRQYVDRHGDFDGIAAAVEENLFNLLPVAQASVIFPLSSYSLKVVEEYVGFKRTQDQYGGSWSMAQYIEATETEDEGRRQRLMGDILKYNEEDLAATWAVLCWLKDFGSAQEAP